MLANFLHHYCSTFNPPLFICNIRLHILKSSNILQIFCRLVETVDETVLENNCFTFYASFYKLLVHQLEFWHHFTKFWCISWSFDKTLLIYFKISFSDYNCWRVAGVVSESSEEVVTVKGSTLLQLHHLLLLLQLSYTIFYKSTFTSYYSLM